VRPDPRTLARGSLAGTVTDEARAPIAKIQVCADGSSHELDDELLIDTFCTSTDERGAYVLANLYPARYTVSAAGRPYQPASHHPGGDRKKSSVRLAAGEQKTGIDITLRPGGVELTGTVSDVTGGPIANAKVSGGGNRWTGGSARAATETAADGTFSLWVAAGGVAVIAWADGYASSTEWTKAPGKVELLLTPESSLAGTVVDAATGAPVEGARVLVGTNDWGWDSGDTTFTDAQGAFRRSRLTPGRYVAVARTDRGYGRTEGSTLVGLGQHVQGVVVKLFPAVRVEGKVVIATTKQPCDEPSVSLEDAAKQRTVDVRAEPGGRVWAEGVLPGTYAVTVSCRGYQSREKYDPVVVADQPVSGLVWEVDAGATLTGRILTKGGEPVADAQVWARSVGGAARGKTDWGGDTAARDGRYELTGLKAGTFKVEVSSDRGVAPKDGYKIELAAGATVERDLVMEDAGAIKGVVVDAEGQPVANINVQARPIAGGTWGWGGDHKTDDAGAFSIESLRPGDYRVLAQRSWSDELRKPGTTDDAKQGERSTVRANQTASVRLVVESQRGTIRGTVVDADGKPVADAFISAARESDAAGAQKSSVQETRWSWDERPVITGLDGSFTLTRLSAGSYTVRAFRKGGGEAIAEHVAVGTVAKLQIKATGAIGGTARRSDGAPAELTISVRDPVSGFSRREQFYRTEGRFVIHDVPRGHFQITAAAEGGQKVTELELAESQQQLDLAIVLDALVTLAGRVVEHGTTKPVAGIRMMATPTKGGSGNTFSFSDDERDNITDEAGRFTIKHAPRGKLQIRGWPKDWSESDYMVSSTLRTIDGTGTIELGDLTIYKKRVKENDPVGELGFNFAEQPRDTEPEQREYKVSWIDPAGPAAKTELQVGDVITSIDGVDVAGANSSAAWALMRAPPGTKLALGLARKVTVTVTLAAP
ncbi:MAG: carboxypeptidase regulatory-like domain-containing protein, partial [Deltaproteobacteria bacterium]|nr:carboxypeptidase regulatory-like domain-containing protein [Deltaproteobacteria bacterium]